MKSIYKYEVPIEGEFYLDLPENATVLTAQTQQNLSLNDNQAFLWAIVDTGLVPKVKRKFHIFGTGNPFPTYHKTLKHISTFQMHNGQLVWHLFEDVGYIEEDRRVSEKK